MSVCASCGRPADEHDRHVRFEWPTPVSNSDRRDISPDLWRNGPDANQSTMMMVPELGAFIRALLPVTLTGGYTVTFGVWVGIRSEDLQHAFEVWWQPEYTSLRLDGLLANDVAPWRVFGAPVQLAVLDPDATPYCVGSDHPDLHRVLTTHWPHEPILRALPTQTPTE